MRNFTYLLGLGLLLLTLNLNGQTRYIDEIFSSVDDSGTVTYATNVNVRLMAAQELTADVYEPVGDTVSKRPVVVLFHTGNFLPQYFNGGAYGAKDDSVNVEILTRLAKRGYVGLSATYRDGWLPTAENQDTRTGTLLQAVYRASQDAHAMARYLRMTVAEMDNPMGIDTNRIVFMGIGSGGYVVNAHNFLDSIGQIALNANFYDEGGNLLVDAAVNSNVEGTVQTTQNLVNHPGYGSDVALTFNLGGALGDTLWIDGDVNEAPTIGSHSATDPFAPYYRGTVIVPTIPPMPVVDVQGTRLVVELANQNGTNDALAPANELTLPAIFPPICSAVNQITQAYEAAPFMSPISTNTDDVFTLGQDNLLTFLRTDTTIAGRSGATAGMWNWFDETTFRSKVAAINAAVADANLDADEIISNEEQTNRLWNQPDAARANIDTVMAFFLPRAWYALDLETLVSTKDILTGASIGLEVFPNPTAGEFTVRTQSEFPIRALNVIDLAGRNVAAFTDINRSSFRIERNNLPRGTYFLRLQLDEGIATHKLIVH
ncbi:MAG: T9SS type A sorting domain-containing protein [Bacteroidota bacterium]